jgi:ABC-type sugar transport system substrate-binding protein
MVSLGITIGACAALALSLWLARRQRKRCRLRSATWHIYAVLLASALVVIATYYAFVQWQPTQRDAPTWLGNILALLLFAAGIFWERLLLRKRTVVFLGKSATPFSEAILKGFEESLRGEKNLSIVRLLAGASAHEHEREEFQRQQLRSQTILAADALVIVPALGTAALEEELRNLSAAGMFIVVIDNKVANAAFYCNKLRIPFFVSANHDLGGRMVAELILESGKGPYDIVVIVSGPPTSGPATVRIKSLLLTLVKERFQGRIVGFEINRWDENQAITGIRSCLAMNPYPVHHGGPKKVAIFCGNDKICVYVSRALHDKPVNEFDIDLIGYDGVREVDHTLIAHVPHCIGTIDTNPLALGGLAGSIVRRRYRGDEERQKNHQIEPAKERFSPPSQ